MRTYIYRWIDRYSFSTGLAFRDRWRELVRDLLLDASIAFRGVFSTRRDGFRGVEKASEASRRLQRRLAFRGKGVEAFKSHLRS
jgi:hypothetical protein